MLNIGKILTFVSKKHQKWSKSHEFLNFDIYLLIFVKNMVIFENSTRNFGADLLFSLRAMGQIYFQFVE